jgi:hypothetical protein
MKKDLNLNINLSPRAIQRALVKFLRRFHVVLFVVVVVGGVAVVIFMLNSIIVRSTTSDGYTPANNNAPFDKTTMKRIEDLKTRNQGDNTSLPSGRTNPFVE